MPNVHSHAFQRQMAGLAGGANDCQDSFWTWREAMYRLAGLISPDQYRDIAAWLQVEMLQAGYTSCGEFHYLHHQPGGQPYDDIAEMSLRLLNAAELSGMALTLLPTLYCRAGFDGAEVAGAQRRFFTRPERYLRVLDACRRNIAGSELHRLGLAPHSLRAVALDDLGEVLSADVGSACVHIHVAEQRLEVEESLARIGRRPLAALLDALPVDQRWCLVHATHLDPEETRRAAQSGAVAGLCPTTEADLGDGFFAIEEWLDAGGCFGIGSDSNLRLSVSEELRWLENGARLLSGRRNILARDGKQSGRFLYEQAARWGAQAISQPAGTLEAGRRADLVEIDATHPLLEGRDCDTALNSYVFAGDNSMIRSVWVGGQARIVDGRHAAGEGLLAAFRQRMKELNSR